MRIRDRILMATTWCLVLRWLLVSVVIQQVAGFGIHIGKLYDIRCPVQLKHASLRSVNRPSYNSERRTQKWLPLYAQDTRAAGSKALTKADVDLSGAWSEDGTRSKRWFEETELERQRKVVSVRVSHILVSADDMADSLMDQIRTGADFNELATAISACEQTRSEGGAIGWVGHSDEHLDEMLPPVARSAALQQKPGDVIKIQSPLGVHLIKVAQILPSLPDRCLCNPFSARLSTRFLIPQDLAPASAPLVSPALLIRTLKPVTDHGFVSSILQFRFHRLDLTQPR
jgi:hypothetical protein